MNMRRPSLACALAGFSLTFLPAPAHADPMPTAPVADTPAVAVVRHFLAARAAGRYDEAYRLLLLKTGAGLSAKNFAAGMPPPAGEEKQLPPAVFAMGDLFADTHNIRKYTFEVVGADPAASSVVLVRATPPAGAAPVTLRVETELDDALALRVNVSGSLLGAVPPLTGVAALRAASLSHLRQLGIAVIQYMQDHDEIMPDADKWVDEILPYVKDKAVFKDPSAPAGQTWGYAYNRALSRKTLAETMSPETTVLLFQSTKGVKNASDLGQSIPRPGRDGGGTDYAFADGRAKWFKDGTKLSFSLSGK